MKLEFNNDGSVSIPLGDLVDAMDTKSRRQLVFHLSCHDEITRLVSDTLVNGSFDDDDGQFWHGYDRLEEYRATLLSRVPEMAKLYETDLKCAKYSAWNSGVLDGIQLAKQALIKRGWSDERAHELLCDAIDLSRDAKPRYSL